MATNPFNIKQSSALGLDQAPVANPANGISIVDTGNGPLRQTVVTLTNAQFSIAAAAFGSLKLFDFPAGYIVVDGGMADLSIASSTATAATSVFSVGSAAQADNTPSATTEVDICAVLASAASFTSTAQNADLKTKTSASYLDGTGTPAAAYLNFGQGAATNVTTTITVNGTIVITWKNLGEI